MKNIKFFSNANFFSLIKSFILKHKYLFTATISLLIISFLLIFYYSVPHRKTSSSKYANSTQKNFDQYADQLFFGQVSSDALSMHFYLLHPENLGLNNIEQTLGTYSYDAMISGQQYYIEEINKLKSMDYDQLSRKQQITYDTLMDYFKDQLDFSDLCLCSEILSPTTGLQAQLPILFSEYKFTSKQDLDNYLLLLSELKDYYAQICEFQKLKAEKECFISDFCCEGIISQCKDFIGTGSAKDNLLYSSFNEKIKNADFLTDSEKSEYVAKNQSVIEQSVIPAYQSIIQTLSTLKSSGYCKNVNGLYYLKNGQDYYEYLTKTYTGSSQSVLELKSDIQNNLANDMRTMYSLLTISPELEDQFYGDEKNTSSPETILTDLKEKAAKDFPISSDINYEIKYVDKSLEDYLSPAFYLSPPIDAPDNNTIYINNGTKSQNQDIYTTLAHEGIPGHMFQAACFSHTDPLSIRYLVNYGGYTEGWATYVEFMSYDYKYEDNPQLAKALSCSASYSLALYSLCDIGINYEGWTLKDTKNFLTNYNMEDDTVCENIFQAVIEEPANYLQYYVGYMEICNIKDKMQKKLGDKFDLKKFHQAFLSIGPTSFSVVDKWIFNEYAQITKE